MNLYAESSAVLAWLLGEPSSEAVRAALGEAELVLASELTLIECERVLIRATASGSLSEAMAGDRRARLSQAAEHWAILGLTAEVSERARRPFPGEPIRTHDAIHLSSALLARSLVPETRLLSLDERIRSSGSELGFEVVPADGEPAGYS
ncbi:MAG: type II toxin-antitoxin system VapC family toxin [Gemmatimonadales bacterium]